MKQSDLMAEVEAVIEDVLAKGEEARATWIVQSVVNRHKDVSGADADWFLHCAYGHIRFTVREVLRSRKSSDDAPSGPSQSDLFPGYRRVQRSYTIERGGEQIVIRLEQMTHEEVLGKAMELRTISAGALAHAKELEDYLKTREMKGAEGAA